MGLFKVGSASVYSIFYLLVNNISIEQFYELGDKFCFFFFVEANYITNLQDWPFFQFRLYISILRRFSPKIKQKYKVSSIGADFYSFEKKNNSLSKLNRKMYEKQFFLKLWVEKWKNTFKKKMTKINEIGILTGFPELHWISKKNR